MVAELFVAGGRTKCSHTLTAVVGSPDQRLKLTPIIEPKLVAVLYLAGGREPTAA